jgi:hypothetical protein
MDLVQSMSDALDINTSLVNVEIIDQENQAVMKYRILEAKFVTQTVVSIFQFNMDQVAGLSDFFTFKTGTHLFYTLSTGLWACLEFNKYC